jgi:hypothetical protein
MVSFCNYEKIKIVKEKKESLDIKKNNLGGIYENI